MNQRNLLLNGSFPLGPSRGEDPDGFVDFERLARIAQRRIRVVLLFGAIGLALGVAYLIFASPTYTADTFIMVDDNLARYAEQATTAPASTLKADTNLLTEVEIIKSTRLASAVVDREHLDDNQTFMNPPVSPVDWVKSRIRSVVNLLDFWKASPPSESVKDARRARAADLLLGSLDVQQVGRSLVMDVSVSSHDPELAGRIAKAYAEAYLSDQLDANFEATQRAAVWLQDRLNELRNNSQLAALEVERFRAEHGLTAARGVELSDQQMADLNTQLIVAQADAASASARYERFKSIVESGEENAVKNANISSRDGGGGLLDNLRSRYLTVTKREQEISSRFGPDHQQAVDLRREQSDIAHQIFQQLVQLTEGYRNEAEVARSREASLRKSLDEMAGATSASSAALVQLRDLEQKAAALKTLYDTFLARYQEAAQQRSFPIAKARVISEATVPTAASSPKPSIVLALSLVLGLMAGSGVGAIQEFRERSFRTADDVRTELGLKFLGYLPIVGGSRLDRLRDRRPRSASTDAEAEPAFRGIMRVAVDAPGSQFAETLRNARNAAEVLLEEVPSKVIGVTSALPGEGKSTIAANFAGLLASNGSKTLLIDADLRNPGLSRMLAVPPESGIVEALVGEVPWPAAVRIDRKTRFAILPTRDRGHFAHSSELLTSLNMRKIIDAAREKFTYIVVDLPPLAPVVDAKAFAQMADGFLLVTEWGETPRTLVRSLLQAEPSVASKILGTILNKTDMKQLSRYGEYGSSEHYLHAYSGYYLESSSLKDG